MGNAKSGGDGKMAARRRANFKVMKKGKSLAKWGGLAMGIAVATWVAGCCTDGKPSGHIYVDQPAVFTRERLVDRRLADLQWLEGKLSNTPTASTLQGGRTQTQFTGISGQLTAQFDPLAAAGAVGNLATAQSTQGAAQLQNQVITTALQQQLQDVQSGKVPYTAILGTNTLTQSNPTINSNGFGVLPTPPSSTMPPASNLPSASNIVIVQSNAIQLTSTEQFQDQLAYRDAVSAEMRERELDDVHDRGGMTLYTLKFDLSIVPGKHNHSWGKADLTLIDYTQSSEKQAGKDKCGGTNETVTADDEDDYNKWLDALRRNFDLEVIGMQRRVLQHFLTADDERKLVTRSWAAVEDLERMVKRAQVMEASKTKDSEVITSAGEYQRIQANVSALSTLLQRWNSGEKLSSNEVDSLLDGATWVVRQQFQEALKGPCKNALARFGLPRSASVQKNDYRFLVPVDAVTDGPAVFKARYHALQTRTKSKPYVYASEPKESAQNLSDSSAAQSAMSLGLQLAAAVPQIGTSLGAALNYVKQNQYMLQLIKREPMLVSYIGNRTNFGWVLGPRFKIKNEDLKLGHEQIAEQESVQTTICVPAWWSWVEIKVKTDWLGKDGETEADADSGDCNCDARNMVVRLRPDWTALTRAFLEDSDPLWFGGPQIIPQWDNDTNKWGYVVQSGLPAQLLILGRDLWRNPKIFIGSQGTRSEYDYMVLPDMQGLLVTFPSVTAVSVAPGVDQHAPKVDLRVVTSDGEAVLKNAVTVLAGAATNTAAGAPKSFVTPQNNWFLSGGALSLAVDTTQMPSNYAAFVLCLSSPPDKENPLITAVPAKLTGSQLTFSPVPVLPAGGNPVEVALDVRLRGNPDSKPVSTLPNAPQKVVEFYTLDQSQFKVSAGSLSVTIPGAAGSKVMIGIEAPALPDQTLFWDAWPGLDGATATLELTSTSGGSVLTLGGDANATPIVVNHANMPLKFYIDSTLAAKIGVAKAGTSAVCKTAVIFTPASGGQLVRIEMSDKITVAQ